MSILFCNISWMVQYAGRNKSDPPLGGGKFPEKEGYCGEECNFVCCEDGYVYGHFETIKGAQDREVRLERLGGSKTDAFLDGIDVVWTAPNNGCGSRVVVGWSRDARVYRRRKEFNGQFPSSQHQKDDIRSFRVRARTDDVFLLPPAKRTMELSRGKGWSGQASWWYANETTNAEAKQFVQNVKAAMKGQNIPSMSPAISAIGQEKKWPSGAAASESYQRYVKQHEACIDRRHDKLQKKFEQYLKARYNLSISFPKPFCDDLRYDDGEYLVMVEVKPTEPNTLRLAIRTAIGQLLDYKQHQKWTGQQLIVVENEVTNEDDRDLAFLNGFGLAWPSDANNFEICWPT